jgi:hypothetical protein
MAGETACFDMDLSEPQIAAIWNNPLSLGTRFGSEKQQLIRCVDFRNSWTSIAFYSGQTGTSLCINLQTGQYFELERECHGGGLALGVFDYNEAYMAFSELPTGGVSLYCTGLHVSALASFLAPMEWCAFQQDGRTIGEWHGTFRGGGLAARAGFTGFSCEFRGTDRCPDSDQIRDLAHVTAEEWSFASNSYTVKRADKAPCRTCGGGHFKGKLAREVTAEGDVGGETFVTAYEMCLPCSRGRYRADLSISANSSATSANSATSNISRLASVVVRGFNTTLNAVGSCASCPAGQTSLEGSAACQLCPAGFFTQASGAEYCIACSPGKYSSATGAETSSVCTSCLTGSQPSTVYVSGADSAVACTACVAGKYSSSSGTCANCLPGQFSNSSTASSAAWCLDCPPGKFNQASGSTACAACPSGKFSPNLRSTACTQCGTAQTASAGSSACQLSEPEPALNAMWSNPMQESEYIRCVDFSNHWTTLGFYAGIESELLCFNSRTQLYFGMSRECHGGGFTFGLYHYMEGYMAFSVAPTGPVSLVCGGLHATIIWSILGPFEACGMYDIASGTYIGTWHGTWRGGGVVNFHLGLTGYRCIFEDSPGDQPAATVAPTPTVVATAAGAGTYFARTYFSRTFFSRTFSRSFSR